MDRSVAKRIAKQARKTLNAGRDPKANRTLSLSDELFRKFKLVCLEQGITTSEVVDELIRAYVEDFDG